MLEPRELLVRPLEQPGRAPSGLWSWRAYPGRAAVRGRAGGLAVRCPPAGLAAPHRLGGARPQQAVAGPVPEALPAEPPERVYWAAFRPQAIAGGDARAPRWDDHGSVRAPGQPGELVSRVSRRKAGCVLPVPALQGAPEWPVPCRRAAWAARRAAPHLDAVAERPRSRLRVSRAVHRDRHAPPGLRPAANAVRAPRKRRGHRRPGRPACAPDPGRHDGVHPHPAGLGASDGRRAAAPRLHSVQPGRSQWALRLQAGAPIRSPAAASGEGRCLLETGWRVS